MWSKSWRSDPPIRISNTSSIDDASKSSLDLSIAFLFVCLGCWEFCGGFEGCWKRGAKQRESDSGSHSASKGNRNSATVTFAAAMGRKRIARMSVETCRESTATIKKPELTTTTKKGVDLGIYDKCIIIIWAFPFQHAQHSPKKKKKEEETTKTNKKKPPKRKRESFSFLFLFHLVFFFFALWHSRVCSSVLASSAEIVLVMIGSCDIGVETRRGNVVKRTEGEDVRHQN